MKATNREQLLQVLATKQADHYKVNESAGTVVKEVDLSKRIVAGVSNTLMYFDSDQDVLLVNSTKKTTLERGPKSTGSAKIKNVKDHVISQRIGIPVELEERKVDGKQVQYFESKMLTTSLGNDMLIEYQEGAIDQHSIGFQYVDLEMVTADDEDWTKWLNQLINPKDAEEYGYMFLVKEIMQFEWSPVSFGANKLTPYLGVKSGNKEGLLIKVNERLDMLEKSLYKGRQSDDAMLDYQLETLQLKQIIKELFQAEPDLKSTLIKGRNNTASTLDIETPPVDFTKWLNETTFFK